VYRFFALPTFLYAAAVKVMRQNFVDHQREIRDEHQHSGMDPQL